MEPYEIAGTYTYRSFINDPNIVNDFNKLQFAEAEMTLFTSLDSTILGGLSWATNDDDSEREVMELKGQISSQNPLLIQFEGVGKKDLTESLARCRSKIECQDISTLELVHSKKCSKIRRRDPKTGVEKLFESRLDF